MYQARNFEVQSSFGQTIRELMKHHAERVATKGLQGNPQAEKKVYRVKAVAGRNPLQNNVAPQLARSPEAIYANQGGDLKGIEAPVDSERRAHSL
jgi:hypothetical protein